MAGLLGGLVSWLGCLASWLGDLAGSEAWPGLGSLAGLPLGLAGSRALGGINKQTN